MKNTLKTKVLKGALLAVALFASAAFCEVSYKSTSGWSQNGSDAVGFGILPAVFCDNDWMFDCRTGASFWNTRAASGLSSVRCVNG